MSSDSFESQAKDPKPQAMNTNSFAHHAQDSKDAETTAMIAEHFGVSDCVKIFPDGRWEIRDFSDSDEDDDRPDSPFASDYFTHESKDEDDVKVEADQKKTDDRYVVCYHNGVKFNVNLSFPPDVRTARCPYYEYFRPDPRVVPKYCGKCEKCLDTSVLKEK